MKLYLRLRAQTLRGFFDRLKAAPYRGGPNFFRLSHRLFSVGLLPGCETVNLCSMQRDRVRKGASLGIMNNIYFTA